MMSIHQLLVQELAWINIERIKNPKSEFGTLKACGEDAIKRIVHLCLMKIFTASIILAYAFACLGLLIQFGYVNTSCRMIRTLSTLPTEREFSFEMSFSFCFFHFGLHVLFIVFSTGHGTSNLALKAGTRDRGMGWS